MGNQIELRRIVGCADACELLSAMFSFPTRALADAVVDGTCGADALSCLSDAGVDRGTIKFNKLLRGVCEDDAEVLFHLLRQGYTMLYLLPSGEAAVWPYEAAFRHGELCHEGLPALFQSPCQQDVERHMRRAGVMPTDARREPSDSVWNEFSFLSFLYGSLAAALHEGREEDASLWRGRIAAFWGEHGSAWLPAFMEQTQVAAPNAPGGEFYVAFAEIGRLALEAIAVDVEASQASIESWEIAE